MIERAKEEWSWCLSALAVASKASWGYPAHWLYAWREGLSISPALISAHPTYVYLNAQGLGGFYLLRVKQSVAELEHLWVLPARMGQGIGRSLLWHAQDLARGAGALELVMEADPHAAGFYERCGATLTGYRNSSVEGTPRRLPLLRVWVGSPRAGGPSEPR